MFKAREGTFDPFDLAVGLIVGRVGAGDLHELAGERVRKPDGQAQHESKMFATDRRVLDNRRVEDVTSIGWRSGIRLRGHGKCKGVQGASGVSCEVDYDVPYGAKKSSGGVAPIHLRNCATAKKPLVLENVASPAVCDERNIHRSVWSVNQNFRPFEELKYHRKLIIKMGLRHIDVIETALIRRPSTAPFHWAKCTVFSCCNGRKRRISNVHPYLRERDAQTTRIVRFA